MCSHWSPTMTVPSMPSRVGPSTEVMPAGLTLVSMTGTGYVCADLTCIASAGLAAGADGPTITVTATVNTGTTTAQRNVAYITPGPGETPEINPLVVPTPGTDTTSTPTDNDSHALIGVEVPAVLPPLPAGTPLPDTGSDVLGHLTNSLSLFAGGFVLVLLARRRRQQSAA